MGKTTQVIVLAVLIVSLFLLTYFVSWSNAYAVQGVTVDEGDSAIGFFNNVSPFFYGLLIVGILTVLILISLDKRN